MQYSQGRETCQPRLVALVDSCWRAFKQALWPSTCVLCTRGGQQALDLCVGCETDLIFNVPACRVCSQPLSAPSAAECGRCLRRPPRFDTSAIPFRYAYPLDHLVRGLKYRGELACGRVLGDLLGRHVLERRAGSMPELLVPVPLGLARYRERGYNQATELALRVSKLTGVEVATRLVDRKRDTAEQARLDHKARRRNVRGAFIAAGSCARHVAIVDDVVTTGSTVDELARVLRRAGARRIEVWAVARAVGRAPP
jgi:ComF family protein